MNKKTAIEQEIYRQEMATKIKLDESFPNWIQVTLDNGAQFQIEHNGDKLTIRLRKPHNGLIAVIPRGLTEIEVISL